ncbi:MAG: AAA family ATPase [Candidatus Aenigmarchaeota archaeon]|nr:AAA family ATPase [Candidatus Aenigmarchaeota archaeon]
MDNEERCTYLVLNYNGSISGADLDVNSPAVSSYLLEKLHGGKVSSRVIKIGEGLSAHMFQINVEESEEGIIDYDTDIDIYLLEDLIDDYPLNTTLDDVVGHSEAKLFIEDLFGMFKSYKEYREITDEYSNFPHIVQMYGPSGIGKTMLMEVIKKKCRDNYDETVEWAPHNYFDLLQVFMLQDNAILNKIYDDAHTYSDNGNIALIVIDQVNLKKDKKLFDIKDTSYSYFMASLATNIDMHKHANIVTLIINTADDISYLDKDILGMAQNIRLSLPDDDERLEIIKKMSEKNTVFTLQDSEIRYIFDKTDGVSGRDLDNLFRKCERDIRVCGGSDMSIEDQMIDIFDRNIGFFDKYSPIEVKQTKRS